MTRRKDARLIAMELRNWMNKKEYLVEDVNRGLVVLVNGLLGKGNGRVEPRSCNLGHPAKPPVQTSVVVDDEHCAS